MSPVEPPLFLGGIEVSVFLVERERSELLALRFRERRGPLDAVCEAPGHRTQRQLGVDVQPPRDVDRGEQDVAELFEDVRVRLGFGLGLAHLGNRLAKLAQLVVEVGKRAIDVRVFEVDRGGASLELPCVEQRRKRLRHVVEDPLAALLLGLDPLPVLADATGSIGIDLAEDVRVPANELLLDPARNRFE